jgi:hypothetical protein
LLNTCETDASRIILLKETYGHIYRDVRRELDRLERKHTSKKGRAAILSLRREMLLPKEFLNQCIIATRSPEKFGTLEDLYKDSKLLHQAGSLRAIQAELERELHEELEAELKEQRPSTRPCRPPRAA